MRDLLAPRHSAHASIRGYLYQALLGVERWLRLGTKGELAEAILFEGDEDLDRLIRDGIVLSIRVSEQVKDYSSPLGIGDRVVRETLARFLVSWTTLRERGESRRFIFTTTAPRRPPGSSPDILRLWHDPSHRDEVLQGIRQLTRSLGNDADDLETALAWLDEKSAWDDFLASIEWHFEAPHFAQTRAEIARHLADRAKDPHLHKTLTDRLLAHVLEVSTKEEPENRILTEQDLTELLELTEQDLSTWAATARAVQLRQTLDEAEALENLLDRGHDPLPERADSQKLPSFLLTARYEVVPFEETGRKDEIVRLTTWCDFTEPASVLLLYGPGGSGKTRLLVEWCRRLRHQGWHTGFLERDADSSRLGPLFEGVVPRLVVIDYAETRTALVTSILHRLGRWRQKGAPKIRLALLARSADTWWQEVGKDDIMVQHVLADSPQPVEVSPLVSVPEERPRVVARAARFFADVCGFPVPDGAPEADYSHERYDRVLYLHALALVQLLARSTNASSPGGDPLATILDHERRAWWTDLKEAAGTRRLTAGTRRAANRTMAAITFVAGAATEEEGRNLLRTAAPSTRAETSELLLDLFQRLYPAPDERFIAPLEPDLLGEELLRQVFANDPALLDELLDTLTAHRTEEALLRIVPLLLDKAMPFALVEIVMKYFNDQPHLPVRLRLPAFLVAFRHFKQQVDEMSEPNWADVLARAPLLNNLSVRQGDLGESKAALEGSELSVQRYRMLVSLAPGLFTPGLAASLENLSVHRGELDQHEEALPPIEEAVTLYRSLAAEQPDSFRSDLASALINLSAAYGELERHEEGREVAQEAVRILIDLSTSDRDAHRFDLARGLHSLGNRLAGVGCPEEALKATREAVDLYRDLAAEQPQTFFSNLSGGLRSLSNRLADLHRDGDALEAAREAIQTLSSTFLQLPIAFTAQIRRTIRTYRTRCQESGITPDQDLLAPIEDALARLEEGGGAPP